MPPRPFNASNWYWAVAGSTTQVYSSASQGYVSVTDPTYVVWRTGGSPTIIASETELWNVLAAQYPAGIAPDNIPGQMVVATYQISIIQPQVLAIFLNYENKLRTVNNLPALTMAAYMSTTLPSVVNPNLAVGQGV